eukprot:197120-Hanusia_phi.AAC.1
MHAGIKRSLALHDAAASVELLDVCVGRDTVGYEEGDGASPAILPPPPSRPPPVPCHSQNLVEKCQISIGKLEVGGSMHESDAKGPERR